MMFDIIIEYYTVKYIEDKFQIHHSELAIYYYEGFQNQLY